MGKGGWEFVYKCDGKLVGLQRVCVVWDYVIVSIDFEGGGFWITSWI